MATNKEFLENAVRAGVANPGKACGFNRVFHLLDISSAEQFEGRTEIYGIMEIFFAQSFFC